MRSRIILPVNLMIRGPVMTAGNSFSRWGMDSSCYRDWKQDFAIPGSHVRGKLHEAMKALQADNFIKLAHIKLFFGEQSSEDDEKSYDPIRGILKVTDFVFLESNASEDRNKLRSRTRIENESGTAVSGSLRSIESPFVTGEETWWQGKVEFFAGDDKEQLIKSLKAAFCFITTIGAEKTVGFGRLEKINFGTCHTPVSNLNISDIAGEISGINLALSPQEPILIGGTRQTENIFFSGSIIPGSAIKGAFAAGLNRIVGGNLNAPIDENHELKNDYPQLIKNFTALRFIHAVPSLSPYIRTDTIPLSGASYGGRYKDVAFVEDETAIYSEGSKPVEFQVDWKKPPENLPERHRAPSLEYHSVTRTAIEENTRRADDSKLYSFHMVNPTISCKENSGTGKLFWNTKIIFPEIMTGKDKKEITTEIRQILPDALCYIGKRQSITDIQVVPEIKPATQIPATEISFAIVLQTPAIILNPFDLMKNSSDLFDDKNFLKEKYEKFWKKLLGEEVILKRFFASQELQGGYLGMRYGKAGYNPFYLTSKGSTFVFSKNSMAFQKASKLVETGLPLPEWTEEKYGRTWQTCPFVPENGYGEVKINIKEK